MTEHHEHPDDEALKPELLQAWMPEAEPAPGFAEQVVRHWVQQQSDEASSMSIEGDTLPPTPVAASADADPPGTWISTWVVAAVASAVAVVGLTMLDVDPPLEIAPSNPFVASQSSQSADAARESLALELAQAKKELKKAKSDKAALTKDLARARAAVAQGLKSKRRSEVAASKVIAIADGGRLIPRAGGRVSVSKSDRRGFLVVEQHKGIVDYELARVSTIEVVTPGGKLTVQGKSFTVAVPVDGTGEVTVSPRAGQAVVATASGKETIGRGQSVAVGRKRKRKAARKGGKPSSKGRLKAFKMMTF